jgi:hypothetical protein
MLCMQADANVPLLVPQRDVMMGKGGECVCFGGEQGCDSHTNTCRPHARQIARHRQDGQQPRPRAAASRCRGVLATAPIRTARATESWACIENLVDREVSTGDRSRAALPRTVRQRRRAVEGCSRRNRVQDDPEAAHCQSGLEMRVRESLRPRFLPKQRRFTTQDDSCSN